jgi:AraC-like DNA-binding protein
MSGRASRTDTSGLLAAAAALAPGQGADKPDLERFASIYLDWILAQRGMSRQTADRREKTSFMLHGLVGARSLGDAIGLYQRFAGLLWGDRWLVAVREAGARIELVFNTPLKAGATGLIDDLWTLARAASELEWLIDGDLADLTGRVRPPILIEPGSAALFFGRPIAYGSDDLALSLPRSQLERRVVARAERIEQFCAGLPLSTLSPELRRDSARPLIAELLRRHAQQGPGERLTLERIAALLGHSLTTLDRTLRAEGSGFREIKEEVFGELARDWLAHSDLTVEAIAARLGYSDGFAFRRWFRRGHGCAPTRYRRDRRASI